MKNFEIVNDLHASLERKEFGHVEELLDEEFTFEGPFPHPIGKKEFIQSHKELLGAFEDFHYNISDLKEDGNSVTGTIQITAHHVGKLDFTNEGGPVIEATDKQIKLGRDNFETTVENGKITRVFSKPKPGGGMEGMINALLS
jgi:hypothetical protein